MYEKQKLYQISLYYIYKLFTSLETLDVLFSQSRIYIIFLAQHRSIVSQYRRVDFNSKQLRLRFDLFNHLEYRYLKVTPVFGQVILVACEIISEWNLHFDRFSNCQFEISNVIECYGSIEAIRAAFLRVIRVDFSSIPKRSYHSG